MLLAEFIRRTGFTPEFADTLSSNWQEAAAMEALPECICSDIRRKNYQIFKKQQQTLERHKSSPDSHDMRGKEKL